MTRQDCWILLKETGGGWVADKVPRLAAALAFYTILSVAPLLVIALSTVGMIFGRAAVEGQMVEQMRGLVGEEGAKAIQSMIAAASGPGSGVAMVIGVVLLLIGASGVFAELQDALNTIWKAAPKPGSGWFGMVRDRLFSVAMVFGVALLLLVTLVVSTVLSALTRFAGLEGVGVVGQLVDFLVSVIVVTLLFAMMYKILPDVQIAWGDVWIGAIVTAFLFTVGKLLIGLYLSHVSVGSAYGAAGSLVVFVVWVYYSGQVLFLGAEFTKAYADRFGSRPRSAE